MSRVVLSVTSTLIILGILLFIYTYIFLKPEYLEEVAFWITGLGLCSGVFYFLLDKQPKKAKNKTVEELLSEGTQEQREKLFKLETLANKDIGDKKKTE
jgi:hypothetical protein